MLSAERMDSIVNRHPFYLLPFLRRDVPDRRRKRRVNYRIERPVLDSGARRIIFQKVAVLPVARRPYRPGHEAAAAVGADVVQYLLDAGGAEGAFVAADACLR